MTGYTVATLIKGLSPYAHINRELQNLTQELFAKLEHLFSE
jgi:hypothetical protein